MVVLALWVSSQVNYYIIMPRPCNHPDVLVPGQPYVEGECRICWLWFNDDRYYKLWEGQPRPADNTVVEPKKGCGCGGGNRKVK